MVSSAGAQIDRKQRRLKVTNHKILTRLEEILTAYFNGDNPAVKGLPSVQYIADTLNGSVSYLSSLLNPHQVFRGAIIKR